MRLTSWLFVGTLAVLPACGSGGARPAIFWSVEQGESIKVIRGTPLRTTACAGFGEERDSGFRRFSCVGKVVPRGLPQLPVRVRYVLNPRGPYRGDRSAYLATNVRFDSFGIP